jgi:hypothetical protein
MALSSSSQPGIDDLGAATNSHTTPQEPGDDDEDHDGDHVAQDGW